MMRFLKKGIGVFITLALAAGIFVPAFAVDRDVTETTAQWIYEMVPSPGIGSMGGEWAVIGLARSGCDIPADYYDGYCRRLEKYLAENDGVLHRQKYTEYSRVILALTAIGKNPADVGGCNLLLPLGDYDQTIWQGVNGPAWALIALDSGSYEMPDNPAAKTKATRELYLQYLLEQQRPDGGWALTDTETDSDVTAMVLQALSKYREDPKVEAAVQKALECMSERQTQSGGFTGMGDENAESCAQMLIALCGLGITPEDPRFVKNGNTLLDALMSYHEESGGFRHTARDSGASQMASEQGFCALVSLKRFRAEQNGLYDMDDVIPDDSEQLQTQSKGLPRKHTDVKGPELREQGKTFQDIQHHRNRAEIEALAAYGIINGMTETQFEPDRTMSRAEFAAVMVRALGLPRDFENAFTDVPENAWFRGDVNAAYHYGIVNGVGSGQYAPEGTITREEAAVMTARAAGLCGMDTQIDLFGAREILAEFIDYVKLSDWAVASAAFCYDRGILPDEELEIQPRKPITRGEIAHMLYGLLNEAELL